MSSHEGAIERSATGANVGFRGYVDVERPDPELVRRLAAYAPPDLSDAMHGGYTMDPAIRPLYAFAERIAGPAVTVAVPRGANAVVRFGLEHARRGDVVVVNAWGQCAFAVWGGNLSKIMQRRGVVGVVIDGAARDPEEAEALQFPMFTRGQATTAPPPDGTGEVNVPVACGGVVVNPGDIIVADWSGIAVVPQGSVTWVLGRLVELQERQKKNQPAFERGEVPNVTAVIDGLKRQGFAVHGSRSGGGE